MIFQAAQAEWAEIFTEHVYAASLYLKSDNVVDGHADVVYGQKCKSNLARDRVVSAKNYFVGASMHKLGTV